MSYGFHRFLCQEHGWQDPGLDRPAEIPLEEKIDRGDPMDLDQKIVDGIHRTQVLINDLQGRLNEHIDLSKAKDRL